MSSHTSAPSDDLKPEKENHSQRVGSTFNLDQSEVAIVNSAKMTDAESRELLIKVLVPLMPRLFHNVLHRRRLRYVSEIEASGRSFLALQKALSIFEILKSEFVDSPQKPFFTWEWTATIQKEVLLVDTKKNKISGPLEFTGQNGLIADLVQSFVQSCILSERFNLHPGVFSGAKLLWDCLKTLFSYRKISTNPWGHNLWRGMYLVSLVMMDTLDKLILLQVEDVFAVKSNSGKHGVLPVSSVADLKEGHFIGSVGKISMQVDLDFCADFIIFTLDCMALADQRKRLHDISARFSKLFNGCCDAAIGMILQDSNPVDAFSHIVTARKSYETFMSQTGIQISRKDFEFAIENYTKSLKFATKDKNHFVLFNASHEMANIHSIAGNSAQAAVMWSQCLNHIFNFDSFLSNWRKLGNLNSIYIAGGAGNFFKANLSVREVRKYWLAAGVLTNISRFVYYENMDFRKETIVLASYIYVSIVSSNLLNPKTNEGYMNHRDGEIFQFNDIFNDKFMSSPTQTYENVMFLSRNLIHYELTSLAIPLLWTARQIALTYLGSKELAGLADIEGLVITSGTSTITQTLANIKDYDANAFDLLEKFYNGQVFDSSYKYSDFFLKGFQIAKAKMVMKKLVSFDILSSSREKLGRFDSLLSLIRTSLRSIYDDLITTLDSNGICFKCNIRP